MDPKYHSREVIENDKVVVEIIEKGGFIKRLYKSGKKEKIFPRLKKIWVFPDGYTIIFFSNGNISQFFSNQELKETDYTLKDNSTKMRFKNGLLTFKNVNTLIKFFPDGSQVIAHIDGTIKIINPQ